MSELAQLADRLEALASKPLALHRRELPMLAARLRALHVARAPHEDQLEFEVAA